MSNYTSSSYANFPSKQQNSSQQNSSHQHKAQDSTMSWVFGREFDIYKDKPSSNIQILNDRDMFNKFSNTNDSIDTSSFNN